MSQPLRLLILFPLIFYERKMSFVRRHVIEELMQRPDVDARLSGQGWADWNNRKPLVTNMARIHADAEAVIWYKPLGTKEVPGIRHPDKGNVLTVATYNEAWWNDWIALRECQTSGTDMVICHHKNDIEQFRGPGKQPDVYHIPHCANRELFAQYRKPWSERSIDLLVFGAMCKKTYPLRTRLADMAVAHRRFGRNVRVVFRKHPGSRTRTFGEASNQEKDYARTLGDTKIAAVCSSIYHYGLAKYVEAAMAGCMLLGDYTPDFPDLNANILPATTDQPESDIVSVVQSALTQPVLSETISEQNAAICEERYTTSQYCARLLEIIGDTVRPKQKPK